MFLGILLVFQEDKRGTLRSSQCEYLVVPSSCSDNFSLHGEEKVTDTTVCKLDLLVYIEVKFYSIVKLVPSIKAVFPTFLTCFHKNNMELVVQYFNVLLQSHFQGNLLIIHTERRDKC